MMPAPISVSEHRAPRCGFKGPLAADWLAARGVAIPARPRAWAGHGSGLVARIGASEFLLDGACCLALPARGLPDGVYPVLRRDASLALSGAGVDELLLQTCSFDFSRLASDEVVMTQMIGVSITALREPDSGILRLWHDPTFACYLRRTLTAVAGELADDSTGH